MLGGGGLRKISTFKLVGIYFFSLRRNVVIFPTDLTLTWIEFHKVGAATEKALVPTIRTKSRL